MTAESIPRCAGEWGTPRASNGPCNACKIEPICAKLTLAKQALHEILGAIVQIKGELRKTEAE